MPTIKERETIGKPDDLIPESQKDRKWILDYIKWCYQDYDSVPKTMFFGSRGRYQTIQDYCQGKQSIDIYKQQLEVDELNDETWLNIDWSIIPIFPKFLRVALQKVNQVDYNIVATPINGMAEDVKNQKYAELKAKILTRQLLAEAGSSMADLPELQPGEKEPQDLQELEIMFEYTFKDDLAVEMEEGVKLINYQNDIENERRMWKEDAAKYGVVGTRQYIDSNGSIRIKRMDPEKVIVSRCSKKDFSDRKYCGEITELSIGELKQQAQGQFTEAEYQDIAKNVMGSFGNATEVPANCDFADWYDTLKVWVLDIEFYSVNEIMHEKVVDKRGNLLMGNAYVDKKGKLRGELVRTSYRVVYKGQWIIDTNYLYNYGLTTNMARAENSLGDTVMSRRLYSSDFYKMRTTSLAEQVMPIIDQIQLDWYHLQNIKNQARPKGISIEMTSLENIPLGKGGAMWSPKDVLDLYAKKGVLVWRRVQTNGVGQELRPIEELENGIGKDASFYWQSMTSNMQLLQDISGLNDFTDAGTPNPRATNQLAQMAYEGTINALGHIIEADKYLLEKNASTTVLFLQDLVSMGADVSGYARAIGSAAIKFIKVSEKVSNYEYGIMLEDRPTTQDRQIFMQEAQEALNKDQIKYSDLVFVKHIDNLKMAQMVLGYKIDKYAAEKQRNSLQLQQANGNVQVQSAQVAEQLKQQTLQVDAKLKAELEQLKAQLEMEKAAQKHQFDVELQQMSNNTSIVGDLIQTDSKEYVAAQKIGSDKENQAHEDAQKILGKE